MDKPKNVQIPIELFNAIVDVMEYIDTSTYASDFKDIFDNVLYALQEKKKKMELREDYQRLIIANKSADEDKQTEARIEYLKNKNFR